MTIMLRALNALERPIVSMRVWTQRGAHNPRKIAAHAKMPPRTMPFRTITRRTIALKPIVDCTGCVVNHSRQSEISAPEFRTPYISIPYGTNGLRRQGEISMLVNINAVSAKRQNALGELGVLSHSRIFLSVFKYNRGAEIYGDTESADYIYHVLVGAFWCYRFLFDGRRHIGVFHL